jgi:hypothetical protein
MKATSILGLTLTAIMVVLLIAFGCASPNVNPPTPRANTGYVDMYAESSGDLAWDVRRFDAAENQFKTVFSKLDPTEDGVLRLALAPGRHRLRVAFLNRVIADPAIIEVDVHDGRITPVRVTLTDSGATTVETKETSRGGTASGRYGRRTKYGSYESRAYRVTAVPQESQPYQARQQVPYAQPPTK